MYVCMYDHDLFGSDVEQRKIDRTRFLQRFFTLTKQTLKVKNVKYRPWETNESLTTKRASL